MSVGKLTRYGLPFSNVVATGVATNQVTPGRTLENLRLKLGGTFTKAMITDIKLKAKWPKPCPSNNRISSASGISGGRLSKCERQYYVLKRP